MTDRDVTDQPTERPTEQPPNQSTDKPKDGREVSQERATLLKKGLERPDRQTEELADKVVLEEYFSSKIILISNGYASYMIINKKSTYQDTHYLLDYK